MRDVLRKVLVFVGLIILLVGLVLLVSSSIRSTELKQVTSSSNSWKVSGNLTSGNTYVFDIYASTEWETDWTTSGGYPSPQPVGVVITSPDGGETNLTAYFYGTVGVEEGSYYEPGSLSFVQVRYESVDSNCVSVDTSYLQARFTVLKGGNYTATLIQETLNWTSGPPEEMLFEVEVTLNPGSFATLLEGSGVACLSTGAVVSVCAFRASKGKRIKRKPARDKS